MALVDRYGDELEYDLHQIGVDLLDFLRGVHPWGKLLRLAGQLPRSSRYQAALADDDELVARYLERVGESYDERVRDGRVAQEPRTMAGWTDELELIAATRDAIEELHASFSQANSKKNTRPKVQRVPRPRVALDRARRRRDMRQAEGIRDAFSPVEQEA